MNARAAIAALLVAAWALPLRASPRGDLLFDVNTSLKSRDGAGFAHCFNFEGADEATRRTFVRIVGRILSWPTFYVFTTERSGEGNPAIEQNGRPFRFNGDWKYQVHIFLSKDSQEGFVFPAGRVTDNEDRILVAVPAAKVPARR